MLSNGLLSTNLTTAEQPDYDAQLNEFLTLLESESPDAEAQILAEVARIKAIEDEQEQEQAA